MPSRSCRWHWQVDGEDGVTTGEVAARLARFEVRRELSYRDVAMEARAVDLAPRRENVDDCFYRLYVLQALAWPTLCLPEHHRSPCQWRSEALTLPRRPAGASARLIRFETEFGIRSFLHRIEREIDEVFRRSADHNHSWPRRENRGAPLRNPPETS